MGSVPDVITNLPITEAFGEFIDMPAARIVTLQADGTCPYVGKVKIDRNPGDDELAALGFSMVCATTLFRRNGAERSALLIDRTGERFVHVRGRDEEAQLTVAAATQAGVDEIVGEFRETFAEREEETAEDLVPVRFSWYSSGSRTKRREIESPSWSDVAQNYPGTTRDALESLHSYTRQAGGGRLLLFHGEPGTGKTTAVRSLTRAWAPWCTSTYIVDPETLFTVPEYLLEVAIEEDGGSGRAWRFLREDADEDEGGEGRGTAPLKWQLIIVEDVDELIRADAKSRTGQALGRLLNLTDGLLGQGLRTMFLLTTNEHMNALHPAIARPGRCLANIEFETFTKHQANAWLANHGSAARVDGDTTTLAQMYALCGAGVISGSEAPAASHGLYL